MLSKNSPSTPSTRSTRSTRSKKSRRWGLLLAGALAASVALPAATAAADRPFYEFKSIAAAGTTATASAAVAARASIADDLKVGVYPDESKWTNNGITTFYLDPDRGGANFPVSKAKTLLAKGVSLDFTLHPKGTTYMAGIVSGSSSALAWMNAYIANIKTVADYAASLNNGTYVVANLMHESQAQIRDGRVTGASANYTTIGKAQQIFIRAGKAAAPNAYFSVWIVGYDRANEGTQLAQITNPKPDIITWDPYASSSSCNQTLSSITTDDLNWVKQQPAYNGNVALSETAVLGTCSDSQMATFYRDLPTKMRAFDPDLRFLVVFNRDGGHAPFLINSNRTQAIAALKASLTR